MAVKYKKNGTWYDISSSSNNAVDAVENGNLNPVTSNAVYDALNTITTAPVTTSNSNVVITEAYYLNNKCIAINGYIKIGTTITFNSDNEANFGSISVTGKTIKGKATVALFLWRGGTGNPVCAPATWKISQGWITSSYTSSITLAESADFQGLIFIQ